MFDYISLSQADFDSNNKKGDIVYFCVLLLWEVIPICLIVLFFRIRSPSTLKVRSPTYKALLFISLSLSSCYSVTLNNLYLMNIPDISLIHIPTQIAVDQEMAEVPVPHCYDQGITIIIKYYLILSFLVKSPFQVFLVISIHLELVMALPTADIFIVHPLNTALMVDIPSPPCPGPHPLNCLQAVQLFSVTLKRLIIRCDCVVVMDTNLLL